MLLADVKAHLRVEHTDEDAYIQSLMDAALAQVENDTQRRFAQVQLELKLREFEPFIVLPVVPVVSVDSIQYVDPEGIAQELTEFYLNTDKLKATLHPAYGSAFPAVKPGYESVTITYTVGLGQIPDPIQHAIKLLVGHWYANRETVVTGTITAELPLAYDSLIQPYKVPF